MPIHPDGGTPEAGLRRVEAESHGRYTRNACDRIVDAPVQQRESLCPIAGQPWVDAHDDASVLVKSELLILQSLQRGREQSRR